jgi:hypothetical protein
MLPAGPDHHERTRHGGILGPPRSLRKALRQEVRELQPARLGNGARQRRFKQQHHIAAKPPPPCWGATGFPRDRLVQRDDDPIMDGDQVIGRDVVEAHF